VSNLLARHGKDLACHGKNNERDVIRRESGCESSAMTSCTWRCRMGARTSRVFAVALLACGLLGCDGAGPSPSPSSQTIHSAGLSAPGTSDGRSSAGGASSPSSPGLPTESPTVAEIARLQARIAADPSDADAQQDLGFALAQRVRESADPSLYAPAMAAFRAALEIEPGDALALAGVAGIQLGKHQFAVALVTASKAIKLSPSLVAAHAAKVDALVELGRYDQADEAAGLMFGLSSELSTLARVSYLAELRGHLTAAVSAMREAAASPGLAAENTAYVDALLGNLLVYTGDLPGAAGAYGAALELLPAHAPSLAGKGRLAVGEGKLDVAIGLFQHAAAIVPLPEYVIALGDAQAAAGLADGAAKSYQLARAEIELFRAAGVVVDVDLALLEADHGDPAAALRYAEAGYAATPTIRASDAVAWALHRLGRDREAAIHSTEALRLGTLDPILRYHAGAVESALGETAAARRDLELALRTDAGFSATGAAEARRLLAALP
jgi:tetratricopeptide (TPR) repeat protein